MQLSLRMVYLPVPWFRIIVVNNMNVRNLFSAGSSGRERNFFFFYLTQYFFLIRLYIQLSELCTILYSFPNIPISILYIYQESIRNIVRKYTGIISGTSSKK